MVGCAAYAGDVYSSAAKKIVERYENAGTIELLGIIADKPEAAQCYDAPIVDKSKMDPDSLDAVILLAQDRRRVRRMDQSLMDAGFPYERIVPVSVMNLAGFDFGIYRELRLHTPTIFAMDCMGGLIYHYLDLKFMSPMIKLGFRDQDYLRLLQDPKRYFSADLSFAGYDSKTYPGLCTIVAACEDIRIFFGHYSSFEEGEKKWNQRKKRVDWDNLVVLNNNDNEDMVRQFAALHYERKACFTRAKIEGPGIVQKQTAEMLNLKGAFLKNAVSNLLFTDNAEFNMFRFLAGEER